MASTRAEFEAIERQRIEKEHQERERLAQNEQLQEQARYEYMERMQAEQQPSQPAYQGEETGQRHRAELAANEEASRRAYMARVYDSRHP